MAPPLLMDFDALRALPVVHDLEAVERINPHRGEMRLLDAIVLNDFENKRFAAYKDIREDAFWVAGHIPGRPLFPGVLMLEAAAQLASFACLSHLDVGPFMGFAGADDIKFRGMVTPGDRFYIVGNLVELRPRRCVCVCQGIVSGNLVFEGTVRGMPM